ncbi:hypothetical protein Dxin01_02571 [Deinococcus xinjiangensis]|uniref:Uncharacterized protein n=1 Tax=Deinococcus xinjiangensis TaxID=457454 RepID=A0ABP9VC59_9DEIO
MERNPYKTLPAGTFLIDDAALDLFLNLFESPTPEEAAELAFADR